VKIALVHPRLDVRGGAENVVSWLARGLRERGHDVVVATGRFSPERWAPGTWDGIPLHVAGSGRLDRLKSRSARKRGPGRRLRPLLADRELVVAHNPPAPLWATTALRRMRRGRPRILWFCQEPSARFHWRTSQPRLAAALERDPHPPWAAEPFRAFLAQADASGRRGPRAFAVDRALDLEGASRADVLLGNSAFTAQVAERVYGRPVVPCLPGVPVPPPPDAGSVGEPYVAWVTSANLHKNAHGFLEAVRIAVCELGASDLCVRVVGLDRDRFGGLVRASGLADVVRLEPGWLPDAELERLVAGSRLLAFPAIDEPFGLVPVHAMAHGRAVLASGTGGPAETVVDGVTGVHVDPLDPGDMARRLVTLWRNPAACEALGAAGRKRYHAHLTLDRFLDRFERIAFTFGLG